MLGFFFLFFPNEKLCAKILRTAYPAEGTVNTRKVERVFIHRISKGISHMTLNPNTRSELRSTLGKLFVSLSAVSKSHNVCLSICDQRD